MLDFNFTKFGKCSFMLAATRTRRGTLHAPHVGPPARAVRSARRALLGLSDDMPAPRND
jgi:hypothetical protein